MCFLQGSRPTCDGEGQDTSWLDLVAAHHPSCTHSLCTYFPLYIISQLTHTSYIHITTSNTHICIFCTHSHLLAQIQTSSSVHTLLVPCIVAALTTSCGGHYVKFSMLALCEQFNIEIMGLPLA